MIKKDQKYYCPYCGSDITAMANWENFIEQQHTPILCSNCGLELILHFEEFFGEAEEYIEFDFYRATDYEIQ